MIKALVTFISLFIIIFVSIDLFRKISSKERWNAVKTASYSALIALVTILFLAGLVVLF